MATLDRKKLESCEKYEPPELAALGEVGKLTFGSGDNHGDHGLGHLFDIAARSAYEDKENTNSEDPGATETRPR